MESMNIHELKDLAMIYGDWDREGTVKLWCPEQQKEYNLCFTGSDNVDKVMHFNIEPVEGCDNSWFEKLKLKMEIDYWKHFEETIEGFTLDTLEGDQFVDILKNLVSNHIKGLEEKHGQL